MTNNPEQFSRALRVQRLRDAVSPIEQPRRFIEPWDWGPARDAAFCAMYGLPHKVDVALACKIIRRYLPVFDARLLELSELAGEARSLIYRVEECIDGSEDGLAPRSDFRFLGRGPRRESPFLNALDALNFAASCPVTDAVAFANQLDWINWCCLLQRKENVWAADDPLAFEAARAQWDLVEKEMAADTREDERRYRVLGAAMSEYLVGREADYNVVANAVEWREWTTLAQFLDPIVQEWPDYPDDPLAALELWDTGQFDSGAYDDI